ncbi:MAG: SdpI family protein [Desulfoprunum sp.]|nr:SdpI family protein [Desulfoprunum sp.]
MTNHSSRNRAYHLWCGGHGQFPAAAANRFYGIRVPDAFASELNWYAINSFGAKRLHNHIRKKGNLRGMLSNTSLPRKSYIC